MALFTASYCQRAVHTWQCAKSVKFNSALEDAAFVRAALCKVVTQFITINLVHTFSKLAVPAKDIFSTKSLLNEDN